MNRLKIIIIFSILFAVTFIPALAENNDYDEQKSRLKLEIIDRESQIETLNNKIKEIQKEILTQREVIPSPLINNYEMELMKLNSKLHEELITYREKHPIIIKIQSKIEFYEKEIAKEKNNTNEKKVYSINPEIIELKKRTNILESELSGLKARLKKIEDYERKIEQKKEEDLIKKNDNTPEVILTEVEKKQINKDYSNILKKTFLFILLIVLIIIMFLMIKKINKKIIKKREHIKSNLLGKIKKFADMKSTTSLPGEIILANDPDSPYKTMFKKICNNIQEKTKSCVITSLNKSSGKTFVAVNLSVFWANRGDKVLLIDANFKDPKIHRMFLKENDKGLGDVLVDKQTDVIKNTDIPNLDIICSGHDPLGVEEMFDSIDFLDFIKSMEEEYDRIILDMSSIEMGNEAITVGKYIPVIGVLGSFSKLKQFEKICTENNNVYIGVILNRK